MASFTVDQLTNLSIVEQRGGPFDNGIIMELRREAQVSGLDVTGTPDFRITQESLNTLPQGSGFGFGDSPIGHPDLVLIERAVRLIPGTTTSCIVELLYKRQWTSLDTIGLGEFIPRGGGGLRQFTTHRNSDGDDVVVCYTYPEKCSPAPCVDDPAFPFRAPHMAGKTECQSGEIQVDLPSDSLEFEGRLMTESPGSVVRVWRGSINSEVWNDGAPGTWRCSEVTFSPWDLAQPGFEQWVFNFLFQFDPTGWNPDAIYRDAAQGKPPIDLVEGNGLIEVQWYPVLDFHTLF